MEMVVRLEGVVENVVERLLAQGYYKTKAEVIRAGILELGKEYQVMNFSNVAEDDEEFNMPPRLVELWEKLIEKSIKTDNFVSEKEFFAALNAKK